MIVTCPNCSTKFNLPETQAAPGAKLRCSVCKHVFQLSDGVKPAEIRMEPDLSLSSPSLSMPPKKKGGIWGWVLTLLILCAVAGGTWWAWTYTPLFDTVKEMIAPPKKQDPVELVKNIALRGVRQYNISNEKLGNISVVEGKVVNGFNQPRELIRILKGFGMEVLAYDIYPDPEYAVRAQIEYVSLDELYRRSDIISLHCPLTDATRYMIDGAAIGRMKPGVMLINTGRGQLIHTEALIEGLKEKKIGAAGLDVYEEEAAYFYEDTSDRIMDDDVLARLLSFNNVVMTSHQGFFTREALDNIAHTTLQNINDFAVHRELRNEVRAEPEKTMN